MKLNGKIALVTGASRGIGKAIALDLASEGATVVVHYSNSEKDAHDVVRAIEAKGGKAFPIRADLSKLDGVEKLYSQFEDVLKTKLGKTKFDILVNNAGIADFTSFTDMTEEIFDRQFNVNVKAVYFGTRKAIPLLNDGARIINLSSAVVKNAYPDLIAYSATKGALEVMNMNFAKLLGDRNITVNSVAPGATNTDMSAWLQSEQGAEGAKSQQLLKRVGQPEDIARVVKSLATDLGWVTGHSIDASGGWGI